MIIFHFFVLRGMGKNEEKKTDEKKAFTPTFLICIAELSSVVATIQKKAVFCIPSMQNFSTI